MAANYETLPGDIVRLVGGKQNIKGLTHCMTRLRFDLADYSKANTDVLSKTAGVLKVINSGSTRSLSAIKSSQSMKPLWNRRGFQAVEWLKMLHQRIKMWDQRRNQG